MIVFDKVAKRYPNGREALAGVSLRVNPGEMVFLTGKSGAGRARCSSSSRCSSDRRAARCW